MIRPLVQSARSAARLSCNAARPIIRPTQRFTPRMQQASPALSVLGGRRCYAASSGMSQQEVEGRIMGLLKGFDKVKDASKLTSGSHFSNDLGLDSLDTVEVVMAIEEEFSIEIPDKQADEIHSVDQAVKYIMGQPDAH